MIPDDAASTTIKDLSGVIDGISLEPSQNGEPTPPSKRFYAFRIIHVYIKYFLMCSLPQDPNKNDKISEKTPLIQWCHDETMFQRFCSLLTIFCIQSAYRYFIISWEYFCIKSDISYCVSAIICLEGLVCPFETAIAESWKVFNFKMNLQKER